MALSHQPQWLFIGGSKHGEIARVPYLYGDVVQVPVMADVRHRVLFGEDLDPFQSYRTETYRAQKITHVSPNGLRIEFGVLVQDGGKRYISGSELHEGYREWALDVLLHDAGFTSVKPPRYPI